MADDNNLARAAEIDQAIKAADKARADAAAAESGKMDQLIAAVAALTDKVGAMEAAGTAKPDAAVVADPADADPVVADAARRPDAAAERKQEAELADAQARADSVAQAFGEQAPRFLSGETPLNYRARLARRFQRYSEDFAGIDLDDVKATPAFDGIEKRIYADAVKASATPEAPDHGLREIIRTDPRTGRRESTFVGRKTFISELKAPTRFVQSFVHPRREAV